MPTQTRDGILFTEEQSAVINLDLTSPRTAKVVSGAGTGKTFILENLARANPKVKFLYLAFNRSVRDEAKDRFPSNVECHTIGSLAYRDCGEWYQQRGGIFGSVGFKVICIHFRVQLVMAASIRVTLENYLNSADDELMESHVFIHPKINKDTVDRTLLLNQAGELWKVMKTGDHKFIKMTHSGILKLFQLKKQALPYHCILCDESQDINPVHMAVVMLQQEFGKSVILVGDPLQQIYSWRGAIDAMLRVDCEEFALTNSFRFGKRVAWLANRMLGAYSMIRNPVVGVAPWQDVLYPLRIPHKPEAGETHVVLTRTNVTAFTEMLRLVNEGEHVAFNGEAGTFMGMVLDIYNLKQGRHDRISERGRIKSMRSYEDFVDICAVDSELNSLNGVVEHFGHDIPEVVQTLKDSLIADVRFATVTVSTVHRFKGLEADFVSLADDFPEMTRDGKILPIRCGVWEKASNCVNREDLHLQYVAITRAKKFLAIPKTMTDLLDVLRDNPRPEFYIPSADEPSMGSAQGEASRRVSIEDLFQ